MEPRSLSVLQLQTVNHGETSMTANDKKQEIANALIRNVAIQYSMTTGAFRNGAERVTLAISLAMVGVAAACNDLIDRDKKQTVTNDIGGKTIVPNGDDILFTCLFIANCAHFDSTGGMGIEFNHENLIKSLDTFKEMTGLSYEDNLDPHLLERINETRSNAISGLNDNNSKF